MAFSNAKGYPCLLYTSMQANAAKNKNRKKSKFQLRYEELLRQQEEAQRNASRRK